jgi:hypothetical protein
MMLKLNNRTNLIVNSPKSAYSTRYPSRRLIFGVCLRTSSYSFVVLRQHRQIRLIRGIRLVR